MDNYLEILRGSLVKKIRILEEIVRINEKQKDLFEATVFDEEKTRESFEEKGHLIEELDKLDSGFQAVFDRTREQLDGHKSQYSKEIKEMQELIKKITDLSVSIEAGEKRNKGLATRRFNSMRKEISNAKRSSSLAKQYYSNMNKLTNLDPQFMDSKR